MAARHHLRRLCDDDGFLDMVPKCQAILKHQATVVQQLTEFIAQYGYLPKKNPAGHRIGSNKNVFSHIFRLLKSTLNDKSMCIIVNRMDTTY